MNPIQFIAHKRDGQEHRPADIHSFVRSYLTGEVADYQAAAWLMAAFIRGLSIAETVALTEALTHSGRTYSLGYFGTTSVDKHSTGGVGDKTSLVVVPLCAALGAVVPKMSGRGLGFTGGTLDKLEAIPGFRTHLSADEFEAIVAKVGAAICAQTDDLVPADGKLYALRDVTATVESMPLIAASVMSKKLALGCPAIVLDVKTGNGAFMATAEKANALAQLMIAIGNQAQRRVTVLISDMDQPLGQAVGNAIEVKEALDTLSGKGPNDFREHCLAVATEMLLAASIAHTIDEGRERCVAALANGAALAKFVEMVSAQSGCSEALLAGHLPQAPVIYEMLAPTSGYLAGIGARAVGNVAMALGAGRQRKEDQVDHAVGIFLLAKVGDRVTVGEPLALIHARSVTAAREAAMVLLNAFTIAEKPPVARKLIHSIIRGP
ncbi:MAG: thymidine phosphorylase [Anaerolineae bacterium]